MSEDKVRSRVLEILGDAAGAEQFWAEAYRRTLTRAIDVIIMETGKGLSEITEDDMMERLERFRKEGDPYIRSLGTENTMDSVIVGTMGCLKRFTKPDNHPYKKGGK